MSRRHVKGAREAMSCNSVVRGSDDCPPPSKRHFLEIITILGLAMLVLRERLTKDGKETGQGSSICTVYQYLYTVPCPREEEDLSSAFE